MTSNLFSCVNSSSTPNDYKDKFIDFTILDGWSISNIDTSQSNLRKYTLEKATDSATILSFMIISDAINDKAAHIMTDLISQTYNDVSYSEESKIEFLERPTFMYTYSFSRALNYAGAVFSIQNGNDVLLINYQFEYSNKDQLIKQVHLIIDSINLSN